MPYIKKFLCHADGVRAFEILVKNGFDMKSAQMLIDKKRLFCGENLVEKKNEILDGEIFLIDYKCEPRGLKPIFENANFAVFDKPSGVLSHPNGRHCTYSLCDEIWSLYGKNSCVAHRLDRETSGILVASKNLKCSSELKNLFEKKAVKKVYFALVEGFVTENFSVNAPIGSSYETDEIGVKMRIRNDGKEALTEFFPLKFYDFIGENGATLIRAEPKTGRQHQIRLHLFHVKHKILGDPLYGVEKWVAEAIMDENLSPKDRLKFCSATRLCLHASEISFSFHGENFDIKTKMNFENEFLKATEI